MKNNLKEVIFLLQVLEDQRQMIEVENKELLTKCKQAFNQIK